MPDKKLTDSEIVKALEEWIKNYDGSYVNFKTIGNALELINRQQAENEKNENIIRLADKTIETQNAKIERLKQNLEEAHIDIREHLAENERLKEEKSKLENKIDEIYPLVMQLPNAMQQAKAEAYKEFAERVKELIKKYSVGNGLTQLRNSHIDNLLKELVGE